MRARQTLAVSLRRIFQIAFFLLFAWLLVRTKLSNSSVDGTRPPHFSNFFFKLDPLIALVNLLAGHALFRGLAWSLLILLPTFSLGRFFCGWVCPLGSLNQFLGSIRSQSRARKTLIASNRYKKWQSIKYFLLIAGIPAALFGSSIVGWIDPLSLFVRSIAVSILPAAASKKYYVVYQPHYWPSVLMGALFLTMLLMNLRVTRFWCRALCPLGALLGLAARWSILGLRKDAATCNKCGHCLINCQGGDDPIGGVPWHKAECHLCMNCIEACPHGSIEFRFSRNDQIPLEVVGTSLSRRNVLAAAATGLAIVPILRAQSALGKSPSEQLIRPPGALNETEFLSRCIRCGECMRVCPDYALQPSVTEAGLVGLWTPVLAPKIGYCEPNCVLCSEVCPTGAIQELTVQQKGWVEGSGSPSAPTLIGTAVYDQKLCLPWAKATDCDVCLEWCPVVPKAIYLKDAIVVEANGNSRTLKQPHVDLSRCVGCGACEFSCPLQDQPGVGVTSKGESRSHPLA
ncbi:MAG: 4Fe-4S binding protein [Terracidiphilus sp.]